MRTLAYGFAISLGMMANGADAQVTVDVDGTEFTIAALMENCASMTGAPEAQVACFNAVSELLKERSADTAPSSDEGPVTAALDYLRSVAEYQDNDTGLSIVGENCNIQTVYFNNYFHISRRNVSTIDVFSAEFDASKVQPDSIVQVQGGPAPFYKGQMDEGVTASVSGGASMESSRNNFDAKSARVTLEAYSKEVVAQLPAQQDQSFNFVLVHPKRAEASEDITSAFGVLVNACRNN